MKVWQISRSYMIWPHFSAPWTVACCVWRVSLMWQMHKAAWMKVIGLLQVSVTEDLGLAVLGFLFHAFFFQRCYGGTWWTHTTLACQIVWQYADDSRVVRLTQWKITLNGWCALTFNVAKGLVYPLLSPPFPTTHFDPWCHPFCLCRSPSFMQSVDRETSTPPLYAQSVLT